MTDKKFTVIAFPAFLTVYLDPIMNETLFLLHIIIVFFLTLGALRLSKSALVVWIVLQCILANIFILKQISLCGYVVTCTDVFAIGGIIGLNLIQECYGKPYAQKTAKICLYSMLACIFLSKIHLLYTPCKQDIAHSAYTAILEPAPRVMIASILVSFAVQKLDVKIFGFLSFLCKKSPFSVRSAFSTAISQCIDTLAFSILGLYGIVHSLYDVILLSLLVKAIILSVLSPLSFFFAKQLSPKQAT